MLAVLASADNSLAAGWRARPRRRQRVEARAQGGRAVAEAARAGTRAARRGGWRRRRRLPPPARRVLDAYHAPPHAPDPQDGPRLRDAPHAWREPPRGTPSSTAGSRARSTGAPAPPRCSGSPTADTHRIAGGSRRQGELPEAARTGYPLLDARVPPSVVGRALRVLAHDLQGTAPEWEAHGRHRQLDAAIAAPNPRAGEVEPEHEQRSPTRSTRASTTRACAG